jgi:uncharacterized protein
MHRLNLPITDLEVKAAADDGDAETRTLSGYGAGFGNIDSYGDVIEKGAFAEFLEKNKPGDPDWPVMLLQHGGFGLTSEDMMPIGVWTDMVETDRGLKVSGTFADTERAADAYSLLKMKPFPAITGLSIGFRVTKAEPPPPGAKKGTARIIKGIQLMEISLVTFPANGKARVTNVKAADQTEREIERRLMQDAGLTRSEARALMRGGLDALKATQDAGPEGDEAADLLLAFRQSMVLAEIRSKFLSHFKG